MAELVSGRLWSNVYLTDILVVGDNESEILKMLKQAGSA